MITKESVVALNKDLVSSETDGELVMMSIEEGKYYGMNKLGTAIWKYLGKQMKVADICAQLLQEYEVDQVTCEKEVLAFLNHLNEEKLIHIQ